MVYFNFQYFNEENEDYTGCYDDQYLEIHKTSIQKSCGHSSNVP